MKTMKYILLVISVACASTMMAVEYKLHQTSSVSFKGASTSGYHSVGAGESSSSVSTFGRADGMAMSSMPEAGFQSTSTMSSTGSTLPQAAVSGAYTTYDSTSPYDTSAPISGPQKGAAEGDTPPADPDGPMEDPIGDAVFPLLLLAAGYSIYLRRKNSVRTPDAGHNQ
jgi:hypothetical protein